MINAVKRKIKDKTGASITFALLIFLVCAVISSAIIVAASSAAGRMSQMAQMDQRYYAVTSVAKLLKGEIDGKTVFVTSDSTDQDEYVVRYDYEDDPPTRTDHTILTDASEVLVKLLKGETVDQNRTFSVSTDLTETAHPNSDLACTVKENVDGNTGLLTFTISNTNGTTASTYQLKMVFASKRKETTDTTTGIKTTKIEWTFQGIQKLKGPVTA